MSLKRKTNVFEPYEPAGAGRLYALLARAELCAGGARRASPDRGSAEA